MILAYAAAVLASGGGGLYLGWYLSRAGERARWVGAVRTLAVNCDSDREALTELRRLATRVEGGGWD